MAKLMDGKKIRGSDWKQNQNSTGKKRRRNKNAMRLHFVVYANVFKSRNSFKSHFGAAWRYNLKSEI